ncbi:methyltransferase domain-containing protein [Sphaerisporangium album]|uniref:Methyltransferase domain-containing protein n=1 Tax=Sphaerisporangium album TaxID=509200 RepID=A0A367FE19_9ACTN|nr:methyltransferase domain-containing protein [Sphaerisporangium album]RCG28613.1 methyltransferase domain-containing protein [Sphaerisporangium album]
MSLHAPGASSDPDKNPHPVETLIKRLDVLDELPSAVEVRRRSYELLGLAPGSRVVDVGCGPGRAVAEMTEAGLKAIGVDVSERMVDVARWRRPDVDVRLGDACDLPLGDGEVAGYRAEKVFHELADPARALREAARVLAPGGRIVLVGQDWDTFVIDSDEPALTRVIVHTRADAVTSPRAARAYRNLLLDAGFTSPSVEVRTAVFTDGLMLPMLSGIAAHARETGAIGEEEAGRWIAEQEARGRAGRMFLALPLFLASARRP